MGYYRSIFDSIDQNRVTASSLLAMPVLAIGGEKANGEGLGRQMKLVAEKADTLVLKDTGHWLMEERPDQTMAALAKFL